MFLHKLGVNIITTGEKTYYKIDMVEHIAKNTHILRPANYPNGNPGRGYRISEIKNLKVAFITLLGNSEFPKTHLANPYIAINTLLEKLKSETPLVFLQFHAATTAEKVTMAYHVEGRATAMIGTHTKVLTADARILPKGTAMITDTGRCGSTLSVGGFDPTIEIARHISQIPSRSMDAWAGIELQGAIVECGEDGKALTIETIRIPVATPPLEEQKKSEEMRNV
jgi:2',3'-cyclic-nucleotide 2'-phosphodiesterase